ncbi:MAG: hypothetical protein AB1512_10300 [Thermodesulfobacteriota bacterium]
MTGLSAWVRQIVLTLGACFFLLFGILLLISAFGASDPLWFIATFFSSTLMILISAAILAGLIYRMIKPHRHSNDSGSEDSSQSCETHPLCSHSREDGNPENP